MSIVVSVGCAPLYRPLTGGKEQITLTPKLGTAEVSRLGEVMVRRDQSSIIKSAELLEDHKFTIPLVTPFIVKAGIMEPIAKSTEGHTILWPIDVVYDDGLKKGVSIAPDWEIRRFVLAGDQIYYFSKTDLLDRSYIISKSKWKPIPYIENDKRRLNQQLIFNGTFGTNIKLIHRGTTNLDSFSQEFQVDLSETRIIEFKNVRIEVDEFSNTSVAYKVLSNFGDPKDYSFR